MKSTFKHRYVSYLLNRKPIQGFTLIELLVVIIIIGILAAIALPTFLNQANKARQAEARQYIGAVNRSQQAYRLEHQQFSNSMVNLGVGITPSTRFYTYAIVEGTHYAAYVTGASKDSSLRSYIGAAQVVQPNPNLDATAITVVCETLTPSMTPPDASSITNYDNTTFATNDIVCDSTTAKAVQ